MILIIDIRALRTRRLGGSILYKRVMDAGCLFCAGIAFINAGGAVQTFNFVLNILFLIITLILFFRDFYQSYLLTPVYLLLPAHRFHHFLESTR